MRRITAFLLALICILSLSVSANDVVYVYEIICVRDDDSYPGPKLVGQAGHTFYVGRAIRFQVDRYNFYGLVTPNTPGASWNAVRFEEAMLSGVRVESACVPGTFKDIKFLVDGGDLFIVATPITTGNLALTLAVADIDIEYGSVGQASTYQLHVEEAIVNPPNPPVEPPIVEPPTVEPPVDPPIVEPPIVEPQVDPPIVEPPIDSPIVDPDSIDKTQITGFNPAFVLDDLARAGGGKEIAVYAGETFWLALPWEVFDWQTATRTIHSRANAKVTLEMLRDAGFQVWAEDEALLKSVEFGERGGQAGIAFTFYQPNFSIYDINFAFCAYLGQQNNTAAIQTAELSGSLRIRVLEAAAGDTIDFSGGAIAEPLEDMMAAEITLGSGVVLYADLLQGQRYCGAAVRSELTPQEAQLLADEVADTASSRERAVLQGARWGYILELRGISQGTVRLTEHSAVGYVYNEYLKYLGTTEDLLPLEALYLVSNKPPASAASPPSYATGGSTSGSSSGTPTKPWVASTTIPVFTDGHAVAKDTPPLSVWETPYNINDNPGTGK